VTTTAHGELDMLLIAALHIVIFATGVIGNYRPSWAVRTAHNIPHLSYDLDRERIDWTSGSLDLRSPYLHSLISPAVIFLSIGLALLGATLLFWALQYYGGISTHPSKRDLQETPKRWTRTVAARKVILDRAFVTLLLFTFTAICASLHGFSKIESAMPGFKNVAVIFQAIDSNGRWLQHRLICSQRS
jgi:hypothetical protein